MWDGATWVLLSQKGSYIAIVEGNSAYVKTRVGDSFTTVAANLTTATTLSTTNDFSYISLYRTVYKRTGDAFAAYFTGIPDISSSADGRSHMSPKACLSKDGSTLAVLYLGNSSYSAECHVEIYENNGTTFVKKFTSNAYSANGSGYGGESNIYLEVNFDGSLVVFSSANKQASPSTIWHTTHRAIFRSGSSYVVSGWYVDTTALRYGRTVGRLSCDGTIFLIIDSNNHLLKYSVDYVNKTLTYVADLATLDASLQANILGVHPSGYAVIRQGTMTMYNFITGAKLSGVLYDNSAYGDAFGNYDVQFMRFTADGSRAILTLGINNTYYYHWFSFSYNGTTGSLTKLGDYAISNYPIGVDVAPHA
jgi:hypothetical protein